MADKLVYQCCICKAVCLHSSSSADSVEWIPCKAIIHASHGICPSCLPGELEKVRRALQQDELLSIAS